ncbi:MAG TPA: ribulose-phosphate 3-epimerase [SAR202 cluster bacterium]|nr:ribulose-phosphate 3-epimerase [SAR202 cluster bacterium]
MAFERTVRIAPSILSADFARLGEQVEEAEAAGAGCIHIDVMDGQFVPQITFGPVVVEAIRDRVDIPLEIHVMTLQPERHIEHLSEAGANRIIVHAEACPHAHRVVQQIKDAGLEAGLAINPATPLSATEEVLADVDQLLVMTVNPGYGGQSFIDSMLGKIGRARKMIDEYAPDVVLEVDGGVKADNAKAAADAGATLLVAGSAVFNHAHSVADSMSALFRAIASE